MASKLDIYNRALALVSADPVGDISEESEERRICDRFFESCRDRLLEATHWPFATRLKKLEKLAESQPGWKYAYAYPGDCVEIQFMFLQELVEGNYADYRSCSVPYRLYSGDDDVLIVTNIPDAYLLYTARVKNYTLYPSSFQQALVALLASEIAIPVIRGREGIEMSQALTAKYEQEKNIAIANQMNQISTQEHVSELVRAHQDPYPSDNDEAIRIY